MNHNKTFATDSQNDAVLPGWMSTVLFNFDEPEETTEYINKMIALAQLQPAQGSPPDESLRRN